jgi:hypothetical protein
VSTHILSTLLEEKTTKIQSTAHVDGDRSKDRKDHIDPFNPKNINHLTSFEELLNELRHKDSSQT